MDLQQIYRRGRGVGTRFLCTHGEVSADPGAALNRIIGQGFNKTDQDLLPNLHHSPPKLPDSLQGKCCKCCGRRCRRRRGPSTRVKNVSSTVTQSIPTVTRRLRLITRDRAFVAIVKRNVSRGPSPNVVTCRLNASMLMLFVKSQSLWYFGAVSILCVCIVTSRRTS